MATHILRLVGPLVEIVEGRKSKVESLVFGEMIDLKGKTALITGASRGIGNAIATLFANHGCNIAFTYINEDQEAKASTSALLAKGVQVLCIQSDAADFAAAHDVVKQVVQA